MSTIKSSAENLVLNADGANNDIKFQSNGTEVASIDQAGTVTATTFTGAATDATKLPLAGGNMTGKLVINGTNTASVTNAATLAASQVLAVNSNSGEGSDNLMLGAMSDGTGDQFIEATNGGGAASYKLHLNPINNGTVVLGGGVAIGGTGTANTLDDYEEGTWTPATTCLTIDAADIKVANYTKIGNLVTVQVYMDDLGSTGNGNNAQFTGLPFTAVTNGWSCGVLSHSGSNAVVTNPYARVVSGAAVVDLKKDNDTIMVGTEIDASHIIFTISYHTNS